MNITHGSNKSNLIISAIILTTMTTAGVAVAHNVTSSNTKESNHVASPQKAKVMKEDTDTPKISADETPAVANVETVEENTPATQQSEKDASEPANPYAANSNVWYVYGKRQDIGKPVGDSWGPARLWVSSARAAGFTVDKTPEVGAVYSAGDHLYIVNGVSESSLSVSTYFSNEVTREMSLAEASIGWFIH